jgi:hypothetical protein
VRGVARVELDDVGERMHGRRRARAPQVRVDVCLNSYSGFELRSRRCVRGGIFIAIDDDRARALHCRDALLDDAVDAIVAAEAVATTPMRAPSIRRDRGTRIVLRLAAARARGGVARSTPAIAGAATAASATLRVIGPCRVLRVRNRDDAAAADEAHRRLDAHEPAADDGLVIDPSVSVPTAIAQRSAAIAAPDPELDPLVLRSRA